jgi:ribokinase
VADQQGQPAQRGRVVVVGAVNVDLTMRLPALPRPGQTVLGGRLTRSEGGKGANQAVAAARAGARTHFVGAVGAADGTQPVAALAHEGVDVSAVGRLAGSTGHAFVLVDDDGENQIAVASGVNARLSAGHVAAALGGLQLTSADVVVLSFEVPPAALRAAIDAAARAGCQLVVNPAPSRPRSLDLLADAIATPNVHELAALAVGLPAAGDDPAMTAVALARRTGGVVVVTLGPAGALLARPAPPDRDRHPPLHVPGHRVAVRDTTGAGDTFTGVLAASLAAGHDLAAGVRRAVAASALAVTVDGARAGMPTAREVDALLARS